MPEEPKPSGSITTWTRLEPRVRSKSMERGIQARIYDPLWLLGRQWQLGEFHGDDSGSPIIARAQLEAARLNRFRHGSPDAGRESVPYNADTPLEMMVEQEPVHMGGRRNLRQEAEAGMHFLRMLTRAGLERYRGTYIERYRLQAPESGVDHDSLGFVGLMAKRALNGAALYADLKAAGGALPAEPAVDPEDAETVSTVAARWLTWYEQLFAEPGAAARSWTPARMEYQFAVAAPAPDGETVLEATGYAGGRLDWYSVDVLPGAAIGAEKTESEGATNLAAIPTPVTFRGAPSARWWEFEDARTDLNQVTAGREDLARLLAIPLVAAYGNEWYLLPVRLPMGTVCRVAGLTVRDTFGFEVDLPTDLSPEDPWSMYRLWGKQGLSDFFLLTSTVVQSVEAAPSEEVLFLRDEMANMAWAVERTVESAAGRPFSRFEAYQAERQRRAEAEGTRPAAGGDLQYRLGSVVPDYWIPLVPQRVGDGPAIRLVRGRLVSAEDGQLEPAPAGRILEPESPLALYEEEVPREGALVTRSYQLARSADGTPLLWMGRRKRLGRGEGSSGLRFDILEPAK